MTGTKTTLEYEINASKKMLYPYLSSASGLAQWYADDVWIDEDKIFHFIWDGEEHKARMVAHRTNNYVKFEFFDDIIDEDEPAFIELRIEENELTQSFYIRITDFSDMEDPEEVRELWDNLINDLKEIVGG
jgi:uncharacterized protein YndB with AHSA1/START domain